MVILNRYKKRPLFVRLIRLNGKEDTMISFIGKRLVDGFIMTAWCFLVLVLTCGSVYLVDEGHMVIGIPLVILSSLILIFSIISAIGIIFRRKDASPRDGFVGIWRYLAGYFKANRGNDN